jgi:hypothetical protein
VRNPAGDGTWTFSYDMERIEKEVEGKAREAVGIMVLLHRWKS